jgi:hypothetical protein
VVNAAPRWEVVRKQAPRTAAPYDIEDDVKDLAQRIDPRSPIGFGSGKVGFQAHSVSERSGRYILLMHGTVAIPTLGYPFLDSSSRKLGFRYSEF